MQNFLMELSAKDAALSSLAKFIIFVGITNSAKIVIPSFFEILLTSIGVGRIITRNFGIFISYLTLPRGWREWHCCNVYQTEIIAKKKISWLVNPGSR